jgi:hypothetical protein
MKLKAPKAKKVIKGSGESKSSQSYLSLANPNQQEIVFKKLKLSPTKNSLKLSPTKNSLKLSPTKNSLKSPTFNNSFNLSPIIEEDISNSEANVHMTLSNEESTSYNPHIPPKKFTYKILEKMFNAQLLKSETIKLQGNAKAFAEEIIKKIKFAEGEKPKLSDYSERTVQNAFDTILGNKIDKYKQDLKSINNEYKELLRKKLWDILYTLNFGYADKNKISEVLAMDDIKIANLNIIKAFFIELIKKDDFVKYMKDNEIDKLIKGGAPGRSARDRSPTARSKSKRSPIVPDDEYDEYIEEDWSMRDKKLTIWQKIASLPKQFIFPWKILVLNVYKYMRYHFLTIDEIKTPEHLYYNYTKIKGIKLALREKIIKSSKNDEDRKKIEEELDIADTRLTSIIDNQIHMRAMMDWHIANYEMCPAKGRLLRQKNFMEYYENKVVISRNYAQTIYLPFKHFPIYILRYDECFNRFELINLMFYLLRNIKNLTTFVDLQDCEDTGEVTGTKTGCNPYDRGVMREMFDLVVKIFTDQGVIEPRQREYLSIKNFDDMKAGNLLDWYQLSKIPPDFLNESKVIYSSKNTTGIVIVLLFLRLRDAVKNENYNPLYNARSQLYSEQNLQVSLNDQGISEEYVKNGLVNKYFGHANIIEVIREFKKLFKGLEFDYDISFYEPKQHVYDSLMKKAKNFLEKDVLSTEFIWQVKLLRQQFNRIFYFLAKKHNITEFYLYTCPRNSKLFGLNYDGVIANEKEIQELFSQPFMVKINWKIIGAENWSVIWEKHQRWVDGILD